MSGLRGCLVLAALVALVCASDERAGTYDRPAKDVAMTNRIKSLLKALMDDAEKPAARAVTKNHTKNYAQEHTSQDFSSSSTIPTTTSQEPTSTVYADFFSSTPEDDGSDPSNPGSTTTAGFPNSTPGGANTLDTTVYEGLGEPGEVFLKFVASPEELMITLTESDVADLEADVLILAYDLIDAIQKVTDMLLQAVGEHWVATLYDLHDVIAREEFIIDLPFDSVLDWGYTLGLRGMLAGTLENVGVVGREPGCGPLVGNVDNVCVVNRVYAFMDAVERAEWDVLRQLFQDDCYVDDCFMVRDYLDGLEWSGNLDPAVAVKAAARNAQCLLKNIKFVVEEFNPINRAPTEHVMATLVRYVVFGRILLREFDVSRQAFYAVAVAVEESELGNMRGMAVRSSLKTSATSSLVKPADVFLLLRRKWKLQAVEVLP